MGQTIARGIKTPIIQPGDDLLKIITSSIVNDSKLNNYLLNDRDIIGITESVVSIAKNNYATLDDIAFDINNKFKSKHLGLVFPIYSRNRFSNLLRAFARAKDEITILMTYPYDEVGNPIMDLDSFNKLKINPYQDNLDIDYYNKHFASFVHPYTGVNIIDYYKDICQAEGCLVNFIFTNNPNEILKYTKDILIANTHDRLKTLSSFNKNPDLRILTLNDILNSQVANSGYNTKYGLQGANKVSDEKVKLFPNDSDDLLLAIQNKIHELTNKKVEVFIYGDGAFKDPTSGIWELADPVVSPSYTKGLEGSPKELKLKYLVENEYSHLSKTELEKAIHLRISNKDTSCLNNDESLGTTPRAYVNLLGSLADLISGSGDKGTPVVLIQNYFNN